MDRNDFRSNLKIALFRLWNECSQSRSNSCSTEVEKWGIEWKGNTLFISYKDELIVKVNEENSFLAERIGEQHDFPLNLIENVVAERM